MQLRPPEHEAQLSPAERAVDDLEVVDPDLRLPIRMTGVKMRMPMVIEVHRDHDAEESGLMVGMPTL